MDWQERSRRLIGEEKTNLLKKSSVLVCGLGGVGSFVAEALARSGVGRLDILDFDKVAPSNINRQIPATSLTVGQYKADVLAERLLAINPELKVVCHKTRLTEENIPLLLDNNKYDYIADAIDDLPAKTSLVSYAIKNNIPIISSMGAAFRLNPLKLNISDISKTHTCPMARRLRKALKDKGISEGLTVVWSDEQPVTPIIKGTGPASMIFVPASAGLLMASFIVKEIIKDR